MAERLNASRTPVREALGRLEAEGLVYKQPSRGVTVSPFSTEAFVELLNVRQLLESEAARLAAGRIPAGSSSKPFA
jgi:DNA-binding GntR family transcriptional regulator